MQGVIDLYKNVVIQISTPYGNGTGFYLKNYNLIVTNEHVVRNNSEIVVNGQLFPNTLAKILYTDPHYDLALVEAPANIDLPEVHLAEPGNLKDGDQIVALGHPYGLKFSASQGIISKAARWQNGINYIQIDAAINPGNSGGPLVNKDGKVLGINSFIIKGGDNLGFALPAEYLKKAIDDYKEHEGKLAQRCPSCSNIVIKEELSSDYCPHCGKELNFPKFQEYQTHGSVQMIETIISTIGKDVKLTRRGHNMWEISEGSATIRITYVERTGFIIGDAHLVRLPQKNIGDLYSFLLEENHDLRGLAFSINNQDVVLSFIILEKYFNLETALPIFENLIKKADYYDDILVERFGAIWKDPDE